MNLLLQSLKPFADLLFTKLPVYTIPKVLGFHNCAIQLLLSGRLVGGGGTSYNGLYGERGGSVRDGYLFHASCFCAKVGICIVEVYERVWKSVIPLYRKALRANGW